jgi:heme-degrading monooxygenase HmoA
VAVILRVFRARAHPGRQPDFEAFVPRVALPLVESQAGMVARLAGRPVAGNADEFLILSFWRDLEALRSFTGEEWEQAVIHGEAAPLLREVLAHHYESRAELPAHPGLPTRGWGAGIIRLARTTVRQGEQEAHLRWLSQEALPRIHAQPGLVGSYVGGPVGSNAEEVLLVTQWQDLHALRAFAGPDWERTPEPAEDSSGSQQATSLHHYESMDA